MNETRLSYGSSATRNPGGAGAPPGGVPPANGANGRNPSNPRDAKASKGVNDWASKKKEQMERAKQLREERKYGSSHLKSAGETQMTPSSSMQNQNAGGGAPSGSGMGGQNNLQLHQQSSQHEPNSGSNYIKHYLGDNLGNNGGQHNTAGKPPTNMSGAGG